MITAKSHMLAGRPKNIYSPSLRQFWKLICVLCIHILLNFSSTGDAYRGFSVCCNNNQKKKARKNSQTDIIYYIAIEKRS